MEQERMKSVVMWSAVLAQVIVILQITGILDVSQIEIVNTVVTATLQILVLVGILNSPTTKGAF